MRRWLKRILAAVLILVLLVVALVVAVQAVLRSDLPRRMAVSIAERELGLSVHLDAVDIRWSGHTEVRGLRVMPPLEDDPVIEVPNLRVRHTALPWVALSGSIDVQSVSVHRPTLFLRQDERGLWNLERVVEAVLGSHPPDPTPAVGPIDLPNLDVHDATLRIERPGEVPVEISAVMAEGRGGPALDYIFAAYVPDLGTLHARLGRSAPHRHEVSFDLQPSQALLGLVHPALASGDERMEPAKVSGPQIVTDISSGVFAGYSDDRPADISNDDVEIAEPADASESLAHQVRGTWRGRLDDAGVAGELALDTLHMPGLGELKGVLGVQYRQADNAVLLRPRPQPNSPTFTPALELAGPVALTAGRLAWHDNKLHARDLRFSGLDGEIQLAAVLDPFEQTGEIQAAWHRLTFPEGFGHKGRLDATLRRDGVAYRRLDAGITAEIDTPMGLWGGSANLEATGRDWDELSATITTREVRASLADQRHELPDMALELTLDAPAIRLHDLRLLDSGPDERLSARGEVDWERDQWSLTLEAQAFNVPMLPEPIARIDSMELDLSGSDVSVILHRARLNVAGVVATAEGGYDPRRVEPVQLVLRLRDAPIEVSAGERQWLAADNLVGVLEVVGTAQPLNLNADGELIARSLRIYQEPVGDLALAVELEADDRAIQAQAVASQWLGGDWRVETRYAYGGIPHLAVQGEQIDLALADRLLGGRLDIQGRVEHVRLYTEDAGTNFGLYPAGGIETDEEASRLPVVRGSFEMSDIVREPVRADQVSGQIELTDSHLRIHDLDAIYNGGQLVGELKLNLDRPSLIEFEETLTDWPLLPPDQGLQIYVDGHTAGAFEAQQMRGEGEIELRTRVVYDDHPMADLNYDLQLEGSMLTLRQMDGVLAEGSVSGHGRVDLHRPQRAELSLRWQDVALQELIPVAASASEQIEDLGGTVDGSLALGPTDHRRAIGPIRLEIKLEGEQFTYRGLQLGPGHLIAYFDPERDRYVLHDSSLNAADGSVGLWGRLSWRDHERLSGGSPAGGWYTFATAEIDQIDLELLTGALMPEDRPLIGRLSGSATVSTPLQDWSAAIGRGEIALRESDIASVPLFSLLYDVVNVRFLDPSPRGTGDVRFRIDGGDLVIDHFNYENRGTRIELAGKVDDLRRARESEIEGVAVLTVSPLPDIDLLNPINRAIAVLQTDVTSVLIRGTLDDPRVRPAALRGVQRTIGRVLGGARYEPPDTEFEAEQEVEFRLEIESERQNQADESAPEADDAN